MQSLFHNVADDQLSKNLYQAIVNAITSLGVPHVRGLTHGQPSAFVRVGEINPRHAYESEVSINITAENLAVIESFTSNVREHVKTLMDKRNSLHVHAGINIGAYADPSKPAQVVAIRPPQVVSVNGNGNILAVVCFSVSFYDQVDYYTLENGERLYVTELLEREAAEAAEREVELDFGIVLKLLLSGSRIRRRSWPETSEYILLVPSSPKLTVDAGRPLARAGVPVGTVFSYAPHIDLFRTVNGESYFGPWIPSQDDILADDWYVLE